MDFPYITGYSGIEQGLVMLLDCRGCDALVANVRCPGYDFGNPYDAAVVTDGAHRP